MLAIDLGTNGEVMVTDGERILTASTAAGPAFEGVNISCGSRAVDGAITDLTLMDGDFQLTTIGDAEPVGLTGSGLLAAVAAFREVGLIEESGRINPDCEEYAAKIRNGTQGALEKVPADASLPQPCLDYLMKISRDDQGSKRIKLAADQDLYLTQLDIRELQKAKGAIRAAVDVLMSDLDLDPEDITRVILTGSFGGQVDIQSILAIGMIPPVNPEIVETAANGAGFGAAMFLSEKGFALGEELAQRAEQVDLDTNTQFQEYYINGMRLSP
ncbi:MAG: ASKHA domain-containing protein [Anaerolineales bacterium]